MDIREGRSFTPEEMEKFRKCLTTDKKDVESIQEMKMAPAEKRLSRKPPNPPKVGRNEPCPCGSDRKFKMCCGDAGGRNVRGGGVMETNESRAAFRLQIAEKAMREAASALRRVGTDEARLHAAELIGATKMTRRWELDLRTLHASMMGATNALKLFGSAARLAHLEHTTGREG